MTFDRIAISHEIMGGLPCIRGTRIPVATVVAIIAEGASTDQIIIDYPQLHAEDIRQALYYAAETLRERELPLRVPA
jgi:uncharacterized protein (DUF433 family)